MTYELTNDNDPLFTDAEHDPELLELEGPDEIEEAADIEEEKKQVPEETQEDAMRLYMREIQKTKLLTAEDERELAERIDRGDLAARDKMIVSNLRLVVNIAKRYMNRGLPFLDLIEEGNIGLIKAVERFQISKGCRFSTYATWWIRQSIERALMNQGRTIRLPVHIAEDISRMHRASYEFRKQMKREPTLAELAEAVHSDLAHIRKLMVLLKKTWSIDQPIGVHSDDFSLMDTLEDAASSPEKQIEGLDSYEEVSKLIESFSAAERKILTLRFGLDDKEPQTLESIGKTFGVTRERIRQIESQLLMRLRKLMGPQEDMMGYC